MEPVAIWIRNLIQRLGMTQFEIARILGCRNESVSLWVRGKRSPRTHHLLGLLSLATREERESLINLYGQELHDYLTNSAMSVRTCSVCQRPLRIHEFTSQGWPPPPSDGWPHSADRCPRCMLPEGTE